MLARRTIYKLAIGCALACALLVSAMSGAAAAQAGDVTQPAAHAQARYYSSYGEPEPLTLLDRFDSNHPRQPPHYFLSLLGTHPDHRGRGKGMGLLAANLARIDELGMPAYLESSNRANDPRYERLGFTQIGEFEAPAGGPTVGCMWRE